MYKSLNFNPYHEENVFIFSFVENIKSITKINLSIWIGKINHRKSMFVSRW